VVRTKGTTVASEFHVRKALVLLALAALGPVPFSGGPARAQTKEEADSLAGDPSAEGAAPRQWLVPGPPPPPRQPGWFHLHTLSGYLELEGYYDQQRRRRETSRSSGAFGLRPREFRQDNVDWGFREKLGVELGGDLFHPHAFSFDGTFSVGLEQSHFRETVYSTVEEDSDTGVLLDFDLRGRFLQSGALNGEVYARRSDNRIPRRFLPSLDEERTLFGTRLSLRSDLIPMQFTIERETVDRDGDLDVYDQEETKETRLIYEADVLFTDFHTLRVQYEFNDLAEEIAGGDFRYRTRHHEWLLEDQLEFGPARRHRLDTTFRLQQESGDLARDLAEFSPRLTLKHNDSLTSYLSYQFLKEQYDVSGFDSHRGEYTLVHQLYESLTSTATLFGQYEDFDDDLEVYTYGGLLREAYRKKNPLGVFRAEVGYQWDQRKERNGADQEIQTRESGTFQDPRPIILSEPHVVLSTVVVTNTDRTRLYLPVRDYLVTRVQNSVAVHRVPTGDIADDQSVWIYYKFRRPTRSRTDTQRLDARVEQQFRFGLRPYYEFNFRHQQVSDPYEDVAWGWGLVEDNLTRHRVGADFTRERWSAGVEYESEYNRYDPFDAIHVNGQVTVLQTDRLNGSLSAMYSRFDFSEPEERDVDLLDIGFDGQFDLDSRASLQFATAYRWENDSVDGVTHGVDLEATLVYLLGSTQIELTGEYDLLEIEGSPDDGMGVWLRVRRNFGDWLR